MNYLIINLKLADPNKETSTFQLQDGYSLEDLSDGQKGTSSNGTSRDIEP